MPSRAEAAPLSRWQPLLMSVGCLLIPHLTHAGETLAAGPQVSTEAVFDSWGFYLMHGKGLQPDQTYSTVDVSKRCECRRLCHEAPACTAFSGYRLSPEWLRCSLANGDVFVNTPSDMADHYFYAVKADGSWMLGSDNIAYRHLSARTAGFTATKDTCEAIPGHRMVAPRFQAQMPILLELCLGRPPTQTDTSCGSHWFFVDLVKGTDDVTMVAGTIPLNETDLENVVANQAETTVFIYAHSLTLHDEADSHNFRPVCQANVFNVIW